MTLEGITRATTMDNELTITVKLGDQDVTRSYSLRVLEEGTQHMGEEILSMIDTIIKLKDEKF